MSLRNSLGNVLKENGIIYGTDLKKLREYSAGNFEGMDNEPDFGMNMSLDDVPMENIDNEGFMSDDLPKFFPGGSVKSLLLDRKNRLKNMGIGKNPLSKIQNIFRGSKGNKFLSNVISSQKPQGSLAKGWFNFKNSSFGRGVSKYYNKLKTRGGASTLLGGILNKVKDNLPKGIFGRGKGGLPEGEVGFDPMKFKQFTASKRAAKKLQFRKGQVDNMRGKYMTQALSHAISPITNPKAAQLVANFNLTALSSPTFKGTAIGITKRPSSALTTPGTRTVNIDAARPMEQIKIT
tara:strand:- start:1568 stop:2443 length:876 start_codon:yes stop_codon:yes gene_type:complete